MNKDNFKNIIKSQMDLAKNLMAPVFWFDPTNKERIQPFTSGTMTFFKTSKRLLAITAAHVYTEYKKNIEENKNIIGKILNLQFNFCERLIDINEQLDIVTFNITEQELRSIGKNFITHPFTNFDKKLEGVAYIGGFPGGEKIPRYPNSSQVILDFGVTILGCHFDTFSISDNDLSCQLDENRENWQHVYGSPLPPVEDYPCGGMSGGPIITFWEEKSIISIPQLMGIIYDGPNGKQDVKEYFGMNIIKARQIHFINDDGTLKEVYH